MDKKINIDIDKLDINIKNIKYPIIFLFSLITYLDYIDDFTLSIILRLFLKHHTETCVTINIKNIFKKELKKYEISRLILNNFYVFTKKKCLLVFVLKKWHTVYENKLFWKKSTIEQIEHLQNIHQHFLSVYDCSLRGIPFHYKLIGQLNDPKFDKHYLLESVKERLIIILNIVGRKMFESLEIPLITIKDFNELSNENIIKYLETIFNKINEILGQTIKLFESFNHICLQIINLINPTIIIINNCNDIIEENIDDLVFNG